MSWPEVERLFAGLNRVLERSATLVVYGPFNYGGRFTTLKDRKKEIGPGLLIAMLDQLGLTREDLEQ